MTREHVKTWLSIPRETLEKLDHDLAKHYDVALAYANGAEVEVMHAKTKKWTLIKDPGFHSNVQYRIKPEEPRNEPWKPVKDEIFYIVNDMGYVVDCTWMDGCVYHNNCYAHGNCFRTKKEAEAAVERVKAALKGETAEKSSVVELDGNPLTKAELNLIRALRNHAICAVLGEASQALVYIDDDGDVNFKKDVVALEFMNADEQEAVATAFVEFVKEKEEQEHKNEN